MRHKLAIGGVIGLMGLSISSHCFAWGVAGHAIVADIAAQRLTPEATTQVRALLRLEGSTSMEQVASWADHVKGVDPDGPAHSVRLPLDQTPYNPKRDCSKRLCSVGAVEQDVAVLADKCAPAQDRLNALKYVIHLVGDIHQPLHDTRAFNMYVTFNGKEYGLHKFWDTTLINQMKGSPEAVARDIMAQYPNIEASGTPADWAMEGRDIVRDKLAPEVQQAKQQGQRMKVTSDYVSFALPIARMRLAQGGVRLAHLLNDTFATAKADTRTCPATP